MELTIALLERLTALVARLLPTRLIEPADLPCLTVRVDVRIHMKNSSLLVNRSELRV